MKRLHIIAGVVLATLLAAGCAALDKSQRQWIFQPSDRSWGNSAAMTEGMKDVWINYDSRLTSEPVRLHALWHPAESEATSCRPVLLYLHGARYNVTGSAPRIRRMQELGFSVLAVDYRGFGKTSRELPSEEMANEDARAAWEWLAEQYPDSPRYIFGHSLGGAMAVTLAEQVSDERGLILEGTFTSIPDVAGTMKWGWLPVGPLITQRFESATRIGKVGSPVLVVHGSEDRLIQPDLGRKLFDAASEPKQFVLVEGGSHHNTNAVGQPQYRAALPQIFANGCFSSTVAQQRS
ncbi:alpha/beta hydrolase [Ottowia thiooxydans]|uniref:Alpha-beta hydrolase superfamily lysophospholipase n=1 Tax=Ottowia thiooxydans TaxID=219182 RepID=A0ABV2QBG8_9BURK